MKFRLLTYSLILLILSACHQAVEPITMAGYVVGATPEVVTIESEEAGRISFLIDEATEIVGGALVEGNIAEVVYLPAEEEGEVPTAQMVTTDKTYLQALGEWATDEKANLQISIRLLPHGRIVQSAPEDVLRFDRWQLSSRENEITLYGTLSLPPDWAAYNKLSKEERESTLPTRRERHFSVNVRLDKEIAEGNTESRRMLVINVSGKESRLYFQE